MGTPYLAPLTMHSVFSPYPSKEKPLFYLICMSVINWSSSVGWVRTFHETNMHVCTGISMNVHIMQQWLMLNFSIT